MSGWQPIDTAPKDGTWVLICGGSTGEERSDRAGVKRDRPVVAFWYDDYWPWCYADSHWFCEYENPTHWMPLPPPPPEESK